MKYYIAVKKECHKYTSVGEDLQDMLLTEKNQECNIGKKQKGVCVCIAYVGFKWYSCILVYEGKLFSKDVQDS